MAGSPTFTRASQSLIHQVSDLDGGASNTYITDYYYQASQSLIHQVSDLDVEDFGFNYERLAW